MAVFSSILIPSSDAPVKISALAGTTASAIQTIGRKRIFVINADQDITITFGNASPGTIVTPTTTSYRIPANQQTLFALGDAFDSFEVFNNTSTAVNVYYQTMVVM